jgi:uncharacterized protein (UPF0276 family)
VSAAARPAVDRWVGIGLRQPHYAELLDRPQAAPALGFVEVHSENFFADGGAAMAVLHAARSHWDVSLHGVGLSLGSACGLDPWHLDRLARLADRIEPVRVSDHASFARAPAAADGPAVLHANDLLPLAFTHEALDVMVRNVTQVQERLRRPILVENLSAYLAWQDQQMSEPDFFNQLTRRTGCGLLLDVNNLVVNGLNRARDRDGDDERDAVREACDWIDAIDAASVGEIHLAGFLELPDIVIDDHGSRVHAPVWQVFAHAINRLGPRPALVEWDTDLPPLAVLLEEAAQAGRVIAEAGRR